MPTYGRRVIWTRRSRPTVPEAVERHRDRNRFDLHQAVGGGRREAWRPAGHQYFFRFVLRSRPVNGRAARPFGAATRHAVLSVPLLWSTGRARRTCPPVDLPFARGVTARQYH